MLRSGPMVAGIEVSSYGGRWRGFVVTGHRTREVGHPLTMFGPAAAMPAVAPRVRVAFLARVSTDDRQDPTLSLPRQYASCAEVLPAGWEITVLFWDIESGRADLERRGR